MTNRSPEWLEARNLALHELAAAELRRRPELFAQVRSNLDRWQARRHAPAATYFAWREFIDEGLDATLSVATERSERGLALRAASCFAGVLNDAGRLAFLARWKDKESPPATQKL
jgi:valyl-tRNA synthetase